MNIVVNGGSKGIGREIVINLAADPKNQILVTGRDAARLKSLSDLFKNVRTLTLDLVDFDSQPDAVRNSMFNIFKEIDILINMAGFLVPQNFMDVGPKDARKMMEINFFGPASAIRLLKPLMPSGSHIVNISSMGGFQGSSKYPGLSYYSASKAAIACLSECLAVEFAESGIKINCLALGAVQTEMFAEAFPGYTAPLNAMEMAGFVAYFAVNGQKFFNGKIIPVAGSNP
jgi:NAD(P)-dependent dehydrogenase (short-subunit alcohol dehydrogenase family)